ncbi:hypothetical protein [Candidatus Phytoplasma meliae]|uniref:Uncharacterized protein n=1 Tax=Candidatus Phytoplasma meliae TaxID=1848402 RepID=A0ABS5CXS0_9MOLU|nr:hypothetical protein [Candidatus Phytoplasma meliae]MBP5835779.1 hypothetical protein [Candidatus Phytoplasma meliae]MBP5836210.1 hypothetical protein [Candidatus Phytoplasma meliae]
MSELKNTSEIKKTNELKKTNEIKKTSEIKKIVFNGSEPRAKSLEKASHYVNALFRVNIWFNSVPSVNFADGEAPRWPIKNPPKDLLGVYIKGGEREPIDYFYTLSKLKKYAQERESGVEKMYIFSVKKKNKSSKVSKTPTVKKGRRTVKAKRKKTTKKGLFAKLF